MLGRRGSNRDFILNTDRNRVFIEVILRQASPVHKSRIGPKLLFEVTVCSFPRLNSEAVEFVFEGFPAEDALFEDLLESFVTFEFLLARILLILLEVVMQVNFDTCTVHSLPDVVKTKVNSLLQKCLIDRR